MDSSAPYARDLSHVSWEEVWSRQEKRGAIADDYWRLGGARAGARVLEVGCGPGFFAREYARRVGPNGRVVALDISASAIEYLRKKLGDGLVDAILVGHDPHDWPTGEFDVAFATDVLHHADEPREMLRALRARSRALVVGEFDPNGDPSVGPPLEERIDPTALQAWLSDAGWSTQPTAKLEWGHYAIRATR